MIEFKYIYYPEHKKVLDTFKDISDKESWIVTFALEGFTYREIQLVMGNPSKKEIRKTLLKYNLI